MNKKNWTLNQAKEDFNKKKIDKLSKKTTCNNCKFVYIGCEGTECKIKRKFIIFDKLNAYFCKYYVNILKDYEGNIEISETKDDYMDEGLVISKEGN